MDPWLGHISKDVVIKFFQQSLNQFLKRKEIRWLYQMCSHHFLHNRHVLYNEGSCVLVPCLQTKKSWLLLQPQGSPMEPRKSIRMALTGWRNKPCAFDGWLGVKVPNTRMVTYLKPTSSPERLYNIIIPS